MVKAVEMRHTGLRNGLLGKCLNEGRLVAGGVDELVVQDLDIRVLSGQQDDLVGDGLGIGKGGNVLANTGEVELDTLGVGSRQLGLALLANDDQVERRLLSRQAADGTAQTRVNTTAETLVGRADNNERLLLLSLGGSGLGGLEDLVGSLAVLAGVVHAAGSTGELGGGDDLHGVGDLLDVANRLQTSLDLTECRIGGGSAGASSSSGALIVSPIYADCIFYLFPVFSMGEIPYALGQLWRWLSSRRSWIAKLESRAI